MLFTLHYNQEVMPIPGYGTQIIYLIFDVYTFFLTVMLIVMGYDFHVAI